MSGPSIKNLHDIIKAASLTHPAVKSFGSGENHLISPDGASVPVHVWLEQPFVRLLKIPKQGSPTRQYKIAILVLDIPKEGREDELDTISRCDLIADWIVLRLNENPELWIGETVSVVSLAAYHGDKWAGVRLELDLETMLPIGSCDVRAIV
jgi:hypothetical protein